MAIQRIDFLGLPLDTGTTVEDVCGLLQHKGNLYLATFINPQAWMIARKHPGYLPLLQSMSLVLPDGEGVAHACRWLTGLPCTRLSFDMTSIAPPFFQALADGGMSLALVGGNPGVDEAVHEKLRHFYPGIGVTATAHGFDDFAPKIARIMASPPDAVLAGMGSPRQEEFLVALGEAGYKGVAISCGGFFDQYLEADYYYPQWVNRWNLRFAWRLYKEPRRLWRRYLVDYWLFIGKVLKATVDKFRRKA